MYICRDVEIYCNMQAYLSGVNILPYYICRYIERIDLDK